MDIELNVLAVPDKETVEMVRTYYRCGMMDRKAAIIELNGYYEFIDFDYSDKLPNLKENLHVAKKKQKLTEEEIIKAGLTKEEVDLVNDSFKKGFNW